MRLSLVLFTKVEGGDSKKPLESRFGPGTCKSFSRLHPRSDRWQGGCSDVFTNTEDQH